MRRIAVLFGFVAMWLGAVAQPNFKTECPTLDYYLPKHIDLAAGRHTLDKTYNQAIPTPKQVLGFELGERYCEWSDIELYMRALAAHSDRVKIVEWGRTDELRRFVQLVITSPKNHAAIGQIKADHLRLTDAAQSSTLDTKQMPLVASVSCSMHGDEASGTNGSIALAYLFAASEDATIKQMLDNMVLLLTPGSNPDGINRYASWANRELGELKTLDASSREYKQPWPGARSNHYYANANRDLLMCQHPEGRVAVKQYVEWMPNLVLDLHEMGGKRAAFFHSPGHPRRLHQYVTQENQQLTGKVGNYVHKALDELGANPITGDRFDDYYLGKSAAYGDVQGSVCLLFEHSGARTYMRKYTNGVVTLPMSIRDQAAASVAALCAGYDMRQTLLDYQRDFYRKSAEAALASDVKGYVFHTQGDGARAYRLLENLLVHDIEVYRLAKDVKVGKQKFAAEESYIIPLNQRYFYKVKAVWERLAADSFEDKHFYDISTWSFPLAYNATQAELNAIEGLVGERATLDFPQGSVVGGRSSRGYAIDGEALYSHNVMHALLAKGVAVSVASKEFKVAKRTMSRGSAIVEVANQPLSADDIYTLIERAARENGVTVYALDEHFKSNKLSLHALRTPKVAILADNGVKGDKVGQIWKLLEQQYGIAPSRLQFASLGQKVLARHNVLISPHGALPRGHKACAAVEQWVREGGTLITTGTGYKTARHASLTTIKRLPKPAEKGAEAKIAGAILNGAIDLASPICYGYTTDHLPLFRKGEQAYDEAATPGMIVPVRYTAQPHLSGYVSQQNLSRIASTPAVMVVRCGNGCVIHFADDPTFRSYWYGGSKMFMNAIYFGHLYK